MRVNCWMQNMAHLEPKAVVNLKRGTYLLLWRDFRDRRKELKMTQKKLAEKTGMVRSYIVRVERGETDMQLSSFLCIANVLRISFTLVFV